MRRVSRSKEVDEDGYGRKKTSKGSNLKRVLLPMAALFGVLYFLLEGRLLTESALRGTVLTNEIGISASVPSKPRDMDDIHVVFSTDCEPFQDWQSLLMFYSATKAGHTGRITRLAAGCTDEKRALLTEQYEHTLPEQQTIHFTPPLSSIEALKGYDTNYKFFNKPFSMGHFLENASPPITEAVVALIDPDFIMLRPLTAGIDLKDKANSFFHSDFKGEEEIVWVEEGKVNLAQKYGLGGAWANYPDLKTLIGDEESPAFKIAISTANEHYDGGPPYLMHPRDFLKVAKKWIEIVPRAHTARPELLTEMYAWCMAVAALGMQPTLLGNHMISDPGAGNTVGEGWGLFADVTEDQACGVFVEGPLVRDEAWAENGRPAGPPRPLPAFLHLCQIPRIGAYMYAKYSMPHKEVFACDGPYLEEMPETAAKLRVALRRGYLVDKVPPGQALRNTIYSCAAFKLINEAQRAHRKKLCSKEEFEAGLKRPLYRITDLPLEEQDVEYWKSKNAWAEY